MDFRMKSVFYKQMSYQTYDECNLKICKYNIYLSK